MKFTKPIEEIVKQRRSVRTYVSASVPEQVKNQINDYIRTLTSPFSAKVSFKIIEIQNEPNGMKLGTYGMIKGASVFIGAAVENTEFAVEALGYEFEELILFLTTLGLGTCWLGGTFNRAEFGTAMAVTDNMLFPAISPIGYFEKKSLREVMVRSVVKADSRKPWQTLFFDTDFKTPLTNNGAGVYAFPLEMVRLAPSASNKQPWRVVKTGDSYHFYEHKLPGYSSAFNFDMQSIDMGIAACHFHLAAIESGLQGGFDLNAEPQLSCPDNVIYKFSWKAE